MDCNSVREDMLDLLYGEAAEAPRDRVLAHHRECPACREELEALRSVRHRLQAWRLPRELPRPAAPGVAWPRPLVALAAAAGLLLAAAAALRIGGVAFEVQAGPLSVSVGNEAVRDLRERLAAQERRQGEELQAVRASLSSLRERPTTASAAVSEEALLSKVRAMIEAGERRQSDRWTTRFASFEEQAEARRRYDLARVSAGLSYLDVKNGEHVAQTTELMGYMLRASQER